jgi:hypothetical protein
VVKIQLILGNPKNERTAYSQSGTVQYQIDCPSASIEYHFENGIQVLFM